MLGWLGWSIVFVGLWLIGQRDIRGFYCNIAASVLIGIDAIQLGIWSLFVSQVAFMLLNCWNIHTWRKSDGTKVQP